jgi:hypothetical protein
MKTRNVIFSLLSAAVVFHVAPAKSLPKFDEVYQMLGTNLTGVTPDELNRAAVQGLLDQLAPRVSLESAAGAGLPPGSNTAPLARTRVFDQSFAYLRVATVNSKLPVAFREAYRAIGETNGGKVRGIIFDMRFANGVDYQAAAKLADLFVNSDEPLLDWQQGSARASKKNDAILTPVAILVNSKTTGAAEALAAVLRETGAGLILGSATAGQASVFKEFPLSNGDTLRVAVAGVFVGDGKALTNSVAPDIAIDTNLEDEKAYLQDPYKDLHPPNLAQADGGNNVTPQPRPRFNEAELVREHRAGLDADDDSDEPTPIRIESDPVLAEPAQRAVADPALARALDLLKSLAVMEPNRPG